MPTPPSRGTTNPRTRRRRSPSSPRTPAGGRVALLHRWLVLLYALIEHVDEWARSLEWVTKKVDKQMEDTEIGTYKAAALVLQKEVTRILLEPVGREAPGAEGVVDLYLM